MLAARLIAVDRDGIGVQVDIVSNTSVGIVLSRPLANGDRAVALLNTGTGSATLGTTPPAAGTATLKDLYTGASSGTTEQISASVPGHGLVMYRVSSTTPIVPGASELGGQESAKYYARLAARDLK